MGRRARGTSAGLDIGQIIEAARSLDPDAVTMQAVADALGVDRKALNHHVTDRENLLGLVALDAFSASFSATEIEPRTSWQDACRDYAARLTSSVISAGVLAEHLRPGDSRAGGMLAATEAVLSKLVSAGFDDETAVRLLALLTNLCMSYARDVALASRTGERPRHLMLRDALGDDGAQFENLARIVEEGVDTYDARQLDLAIDVFLVGAAAKLPPSTALGR
jgi:TetR/AcrR family tetracycline transcriptional repressor